MAIRAYILYSAAAAAASLSTAQILRNGEIIGVNFSLYAAVGNGAASEVSMQAARQWGTAGAQGILATAVLSNAATGPSQLQGNHYIPLPRGCTVKVGDVLYLHATQLGAGGTITQSITVYVQES